MRTLTTREKRTVRYAGIGIGIYLVLFGGFHARKYLEARRADYQKLVVEAQNLQRELQPYHSRAEVVKKLMDDFKMDPAKLTRANVVAEASAAIQKIATSGGMQVGPIRESPARSSKQELASVQFEGTGQIASVMALLNQMESLGFPVVVDSIQITPDRRPGQLKLNMTVTILDFDQWKEEKPNA